MATDRDLVIETTTKLTWYVDNTRWSALLDLFTDRVTVDYTSLNGGEPGVVTAVDLVRSWKTGLEHLDATQHVVSNHLVELDEVARTAEVTAHFIATHLRTDSAGPVSWRLGGQYRWTLHKANDLWRITSITMTALWSEGNRDIMNPPTNQD